MTPVPHHTIKLRKGTYIPTTLASITPNMYLHENSRLLFSCWLIILVQYFIDAKISFTVFQDSSLFLSEYLLTSNGTRRVTGAIISAEVHGVNVTNLTEPVLIEMEPFLVSKSSFH